MLKKSDYLLSHYFYSMLDQVTDILDLFFLIIEYLSIIDLYHLQLLNPRFYQLINKYKQEKLKIFRFFVSPADFYQKLIQYNFESFGNFENFENLNQIKKLYPCINYYFDEEIVIGIINLSIYDQLSFEFESFVKYEGGDYITLFLDGYKKKYEMHIILFLLDRIYENDNVDYFFELSSLLESYQMVYFNYIKTNRDKKGNIISQAFHSLFEVGAIYSLEDFKNDYPFLFCKIVEKYGHSKLCLLNDFYVDRVYECEWIEI